MKLIHKGKAKLTKIKPILRTAWSRPRFKKSTAAAAIFLFACVGVYMLWPSRADVVPTITTAPSYQGALSSNFPRVMNYKALSASNDSKLSCTDQNQFNADVVSLGLDKFSAIEVPSIDGGNSACAINRTKWYKQLFPNKLALIYKSPNADYPNSYADNWPGYFIMLNRYTLTANLPANQLTSTVGISSVNGLTNGVKVGDLVVISETIDSDLFGNFEYARVSAVNASTVTLLRGPANLADVALSSQAQAKFHSTSNSHLEVVSPGLGGATNFLYNYADNAPVNPANNKRANQWVADKLVAEFPVDASAPVADGYELDVARWWPIQNSSADRGLNSTNRHFDCDGNGIIDYCIKNIGGEKGSPAPEISSYGVGYQQFLAAVRSGIAAKAGSDKLILADSGYRDAANGNGAEFEHFPVGENYSRSSAALEDLSWFMRDAGGPAARMLPRVTYNYTKQPTSLYPTDLNGAVSCDNSKDFIDGACNNRRNRYGLVSATLFGAYHAYSPEGDANWGGVAPHFGVYPWDEDVGRSVTGATASDVGYLGQPTGTGEVTTSATAYSTGNLVSNPSFTSDLSGWAANVGAGSSTGTTPVLDSSAPSPAGGNAMRVDVNKLATNPGAGIQPILSDVQLNANLTAGLTTGSNYTVEFWARSETNSVHEIQVNLRNTGGGATATTGQQIFKVDSQWHHYTLNFNVIAGATTSKLNFGVGRELGSFYFDEVRLYKGTPGALTREFTNGMVLLNDATTPQTVTIPAGFKRINGSQDRSINDGSVVNGSVTIAAKDGLILLRDGGSPPPPPPPPAGTGLTGAYYNDANFGATQLKLTRLDPKINFNWLSGSPAASIDPDTFSVRWTGFVQPTKTETYTFYTVSDDGVRLWVNGQPIIDNWPAHTATTNKGTIALNANQKYAIKLEYYDNTGTSQIKLLWSSPSISKVVVPTSQLYPN